MPYPTLQTVLTGKEILTDSSTFASIMCRIQTIKTCISYFPAFLTHFSSCEFSHFIDFLFFLDRLHCSNIPYPYVGVQFNNKTMPMQKNQEISKTIDRWMVPRTDAIDSSSISN
eukprot:224396_1